MECAEGKTRNPKVVAMEKGPHGFKEVCGGCEKFMRWLPKEQPDWATAAGRYTGLCSEWESNFLNSISSQKKLSAKQQAIYDRIVTQYGARKPVYYGEHK
jgi:hypothetical protein